MPKLIRIPAAPVRVRVLSRAVGCLARAFRKDEPPVDRRRHTRWPAHGLITMLWSENERRERQARVHALDLSPAGLAFRFATPVPAGQTITLSDGDAILSVEVRHCTPDGADFAIGTAVRRFDRSGGTSFLRRNDGTVPAIVDIVDPSEVLKSESDVS